MRGGGSSGSAREQAVRTGVGQHRGKQAAELGDHRRRQPAAGGQQQPAKRGGVALLQARLRRVQGGCQLVARQLVHARRQRRQPPQIGARLRPHLLRLRSAYNVFRTCVTEAYLHYKPINWRRHVPAPVLPVHNCTAAGEFQSVSLQCFGYHCAARQSSPARSCRNGLQVTSRKGTGSKGKKGHRSTSNNAAMTIDVINHAQTLRIRTGSARHLRKVVCSCGRKGLSAGPALPSSASSVPRMAALTPDAKRSPMMRISGPVICEVEG